MYYFKLSHSIVNKARLCGFKLSKGSAEVKRPAPRLLMLEDVRGQRICGVSPWLREHRPSRLGVSTTFRSLPACECIRTRGAWNERVPHLPRLKNTFWMVPRILKNEEKRRNTGKDGTRNTENEDRRVGRKLRAGWKHAAVQEYAEAAWRAGNSRSRASNSSHYFNSRNTFCHQLMSGTYVNKICNFCPVGTGLHKVAQSHAATGPIWSLARWTRPPTPL